MGKKRVYKRNILALALVLFVVIILVLILGNHKTESDTESGVVSTDTKLSSEEYKNPFVRARTERISPREAQIEIYHEFPDEFMSASFNDKVFHLVPYPDSIGHKISNYQIQPGGHRAGIYVYEGDKIVWESTNYIADISVGEARFQDLTNDGISEIVAVDHGGGNVTYCIANIYKWNGELFILMVPDPQEDGINLCSGLNNESEGIHDIDNDGIFELVSYLKRKVHPEIHDTDNPLYFEEETVKQIYKYNGTEYFLWKEEIVPVEE
jgi:hypothetical protein